MFWFYSHPAVYIMILPAMGVASEVVAAFTRKKIFGYKFVAYSSLAIAFLGFLVWAHHLFVAGISVYSALIFAFLSYFVAVPSAIKVFNWTATLYKASVSWQTPMLYILGFIGSSPSAVSRVFSFRRSASTSTSPTLTLSWPTSITSWSAAWSWPTWLGFTTGGRRSRDACIPSGGPAWRRCSSSSLQPDLLPQFILGYLGMPRRYHAYAPEFQVLNVMSTAGASVLAVGYLLPIIYLTWSLRFGRKAGANPGVRSAWSGPTSSPPPKENFHETPVVTWMLTIIRP